MDIRDPIATYNAANNLEAHFVCSLLIDAGIEAPSHPAALVSRLRLGRSKMCR
jgi:hypothetical protein